MRLAFLFDVDNTLIDNDRVKADMEERTREMLGEERASRFWEIYEEIRQECDFVDFPRTLERYSQQFPDEPRFPRLAARLLCYPYREFLFPGAVEAIEHVKEFADVAIVSDGDRVFQPSKIARAGLADAVSDKVLIFTHKEEEFDEVEERVPAERYVVVDDKPNILGELKTRLGSRSLTVHVRQGKYATERSNPPADLELDAIAELREFGESFFVR